MSSAKPYVNDFDLVESMPGAHCSATGPQRAQFVSRSIKCWETEKREEAEEAAARNQEASLQTEREVLMLVEMFPLLDKKLIHNMHAENASFPRCVEELMALNEAVSAGQTTDAASSASSSAASSSAPSKPRIVVDRQDEQAWPVLTGEDGWQVCANMDDLDNLDAQESPREWANRAAAAASLPAPPASNVGKQEYRDYSPNRVGSKKDFSPCRAGEEEGVDEYGLRRQIGEANRSDKMRDRKFRSRAASQKSEPESGEAQEAEEVTDAVEKIVSQEVVVLEDI